MTTFHTLYPKIMPKILLLLSDKDETVQDTALSVAKVIVNLMGPERPALTLSAFTPAAIVCSSPAGRENTLTALNVLCDELYDQKMPGGDLLTAQTLPTKQKELLTSHLVMLRSDPERAVARLAAQIWHKCIANPPKTVELCKPYVKRTVAELKHLGCSPAVVDVLVEEFGVDDAWVPKEEKKQQGPAADGDAASDSTKVSESASAAGPAATVEKVTQDPFLSLLAVEAQKAGVRQGAFRAETGAWGEAAVVDALVAMLHSEDAGHASGNELVRVENLLLMYGGGAEPLLQDAVLRLEKGHVYGVVGRNGCGKTTLMKMLHSKSIAAVPKYLRFAMVSDQKSLNGADVLSALQYCMQETGMTEEIAAEALMENGFDEVMYSKRVNDLSGGWKMRLLLTNAMMFETDVLLLDEPTNHLDVQAVAWLERYVQGVQTKRDQTIMVISHEPKFLNAVCTDIMKYSADRKLEYYAGNFEAFLRQNPEAFTAANMEEALGVAVEKEKKFAPA